MNDLNIIISVLNSLGLGGVGIFLYLVYKGLKQRITDLSDLVAEQKKTLEAVRERANEIDKLSQYYKQALEDFQDMGNRLGKRRKELIEELEDAIKKKDEQLTELKKNELKEIESKYEGLKRIHEIEDELLETLKKLQSQIENITLHEENKNLALETKSLIFDSTLSLFPYYNNFFLQKYIHIAQSAEILGKNENKSEEKYGGFTVSVPPGADTGLKTTEEKDKIRIFSSLSENETKIKAISGLKKDKK